MVTSFSISKVHNGKISKEGEGCTRRGKCHGRGLARALGLRSKPMVISTQGPGAKKNE